MVYVLAIHSLRLIHSSNLSRFFLDSFRPAQHLSKNISSTQIHNDKKPILMQASQCSTAFKFFTVTLRAIRLAVYFFEVDGCQTQVPQHSIPSSDPQS